MPNHIFKVGFHPRRLSTVWLAAVALCVLVALPFWPVSAQSELDNSDETVSLRRIQKHKVSGRHSDWLWPLRSVPRRWTVMSGNPPRRTLGTTPLVRAEFNGEQFRYPPPIPPPGRWHFTIWPLYFGMTTHAGWHFRIGVRYDDI